MPVRCDGMRQRQCVGCWAAASKHLGRRVWSIPGWDAQLREGWARAKRSGATSHIIRSHSSSLVRDSAGASQQMIGQLEHWVFHPQSQFSGLRGGFLLSNFNRQQPVGQPVSTATPELFISNARRVFEIRGTKFDITFRR